MLGRRKLLAVAAALAPAMAVRAQEGAGQYPSKPIRIISPFAAGGSVDVLARVLGQKLTEAWGQPVVVEARPGANTAIGTEAAARARPDGYTLIIVVSNHATNPVLQPKLPYDTLKDFTPVSLLARTPIVAYGSPRFPVANLRELVAYAKAHPDGISFGSAGTGSVTHLTGEMLNARAGLDMTHVVYRGGTPALNDVMAGHIQMTFATVGQALPQYRAGQVRALGVSSATRYASIPEVPTFREQGIDVVTTEWFGLMAPAGTPPDIVDKLNAQVRRILAMPDLGDRLTAIELVGSSPAELDRLIRDEMARWQPFIRERGIKAT